MLPTSVGTISALNSSLCAATGTTLTLSFATGSIAWQKATVTGGVIGTFSAVSGNTSTSLITGNLSTTKAYKAIVSNGVCSSSSSQPITITVSPTAKVTAITGSNTITTPACIGATQTLTLTAGYAGTIEWLSSNILAGTYTVISGATSATYNYVPTSTTVKYFKVRLTSAPCSTVQKSATGIAVYSKNCPITNTTTKQIIDEFFENSTIKVNAYPNPFIDFFKLGIETNSLEVVELNVYDMTGRLIETSKVDPTKLYTLELGLNLPTGVYNIVVIQGDQVNTLRVIKR